MLMQVLRVVQSLWNVAVLGSAEDGTVKYIYIPYPPAMFPVAAVAPVRVEEVEQPAEEGLEALWREGRTA